MSNVHIRFKPIKNDDGRSHVLSLFECEETGALEVAHIVDGHIEGEPFRFAELTSLIQVMIDAMECNFNTFRTIEVKLELVSNDNNVVELPTSSVNED